MKKMLPIALLGINFLTGILMIYPLEKIISWVSIHMNKIIVIINSM